MKTELDLMRREFPSGGHKSVAAVDSQLMVYEYFDWKEMRPPYSTRRSPYVQIVTDVHAAYGVCSHASSFRPRSARLLTGEPRLQIRYSKMRLTK